eukprot:GHVN01006240.1.p1 GENE.GHVN01006240.1~~GHVN01006240.1.p1  ORF type:complete len:245 (+),score=30.26 GHVN01006240.1:80-814(+)
MDFQNRVGHKTGGGAPASAQDLALDRRERLRRLAMETIDLTKDPYMIKSHHGQIECKLCLTLHTNVSSYLSHTQGKKHQTNLARRAAKEKLDAGILPQPHKVTPKKSVKIGRPGFRVTKMRDPDNQQKALLFEIEYPEIDRGSGVGGGGNARPRHRFMSAWEQKIEAPDGKYQYLLFAADPYETIAFKVPNLEIERSDTKKHYCNWDEERNVYTLQVYFKTRDEKPLPTLPQRPSTFLPIGVRW